MIRQPWPAMLRTIYGDPERYVQNYWSQIPGTYFTGDGARKDKDGYYWIMGRVDDVLTPTTRTATAAMPTSVRRETII